MSLNKIIQNMYLIAFSIFTDLDKMSSSEFHDFIQFKELQYHQRRQRLKEFCQNSVEDKVLWKHLVSPNKNAIIFDQVHHLAYCQIAKVIIIDFSSSASYVMHIMTLCVFFLKGGFLYLVHAFSQLSQCFGTVH